MAQEFTAAYKAEFGEDPGTFSSAAYAGVLALVNAIEKAGSTDYDAVRANLLSESVSTTIGEIGFDANGDVTGTGFAMYRVVNGKFTKQ
jgi:branched-chain amino acid transport system substrate-binding protein